MRDTPALRRIVHAVIAAEVVRLRGPGATPLPPGPWPDDLPLGDAGLGADSLERLGITAALAETFDLDAAALDAAPPGTLADLLGWIVRDDRDDATITVATSGSTGTPVTCTHAWSDLTGEARHFAGLLGDRRRVVALVPAHHIYGMVWTALLPDLLGIPVAPRPIGARLDLCDGDMIVAVPEQWRALLRLHRSFPAGLVGITSGGPLPPGLGEALLAAGLSRLIDIYGSSETGGIALRDLPATDYQLLPRWRLTPAGDDWDLIDDRARRIALPDRVARIGERHLRLLGRRDGAVQIGGRNVWPAQVAATLGATAGVEDITVRLGANGRLKAFVVPAPGADTEDLARALERSAALLAEAERPRAFAFGPALPRNPMGKLTDWA
ncbi:MAG: AMP-binding protein [Sphingomonas sp.]